MLQALPSDILFGILQHFPSGPIYFGEGLKQQTYLSSIFQRLRAIALPNLYGQVYIYYNTDKHNRIQRYSNKYSNTFAEYIDTNANMIALANCTHMVKSAIMGVSVLSTDHAEFHDVVEVLKSCAVTWPNIFKLELYIEYDINYNVIGGLRRMQCCRASKECSQELASTIPSVTELDLRNTAGDYDITEIFSQLSDAYANQLVNLFINSYVERAGRHKLKVLQHLYIGMPYSTELLPRVNSHTLVDLHIEDMPLKFPWAEFMDPQDNTVIEFPCLKKLRLEFADYDLFEHTDVDLPEVLLNFPVLSSLTVKCYEGFCSFFKMARFPKEMEYIYLHISSAMLAQLKDVGITTAKKERIYIW